MSKITVVIITYNEESNIEDCLKNTTNWADEVVVIDAHSSDRTVEIAKNYTDKIYLNEFKDFSSQRNFGLLKVSFEWVLSLDADERITYNLKEKILHIINSLSAEDGYFIKRNDYIYGKEFRYGGHNKDYQLRLFKKEGAKFFQPVHEKLLLKGSKIGYIEEPIEHYSTRNLSEHITKINHYTELEATFILEENKRFLTFKIITRPLARFFQRYILQRGFMDGWEGFIYYLISAVCDFIKYAKVMERLERE